MNRWGKGKQKKGEQRLRCRVCRVPVGATTAAAAAVSRVKAGSAAGRLILSLSLSIETKQKRDIPPANQPTYIYPTPIPNQILELPRDPYLITYSVCVTVV